MRDADRELAGSSYLGERHTRHEAALVKIQCLADPGCAGWVAGLFGPAPLWQRGAIEGCDLGQVFDPKCLVNGLGLGRTRLQATIAAPASWSHGSWVSVTATWSTARTSRPSTAA